MKRILLAGGGTAGHAFPVIAVGKILKSNQRLKLLYAGGNSSFEKDAAQEAELPFKKIHTGKRRAYFSLLNIADFIKTAYGILQCYFIYLSFKPDVVFAKGGYITFPIIFWAKRFRTPLIIHESDVILGKANAYAARNAKKLCLGFPIKYFSRYNRVSIPVDKMIYTGIPLRKGISLDFSEEKDHLPRIVITGGSQGAKKINELISEILPELLKKYQVFHVAGQGFVELQDKFGTQKNYHLYNFANDLPKLLATADLIISRSGANTLAEISALKKAAVLIPLPTSSQNHQYYNAKVYEEVNAAVLLNQKNLTSTSLLSIIDRLMEDSELRKLLGHHAYEFFVSDSSRIIADLIYEEI